MKKIRVLIKDPGKAGRILEINDELETLQEIVGGYIEIVKLDEAVAVICNEDGKLLGLQPNIAFSNDVFVGTVIFAGYKGDELTDFPYGDTGEVNV